MRERSMACSGRRPPGHGGSSRWTAIRARTTPSYCSPAVPPVPRQSGRAMPIDVDRLRVAICGRPVFAGEPIPFDATAVRSAMDAQEVVLRLELGSGSGRGEAFGCDLTERYVIENSEYS